jgi:hypothetical protein
MFTAIRRGGRARSRRERHCSGTNQPQVSLNVEVKAGWIIDLSEPGQPAEKIVGGEVIDAKAIDAKPE